MKNLEQGLAHNKHTFKYLFNKQMTVLSIRKEDEIRNMTVNFKQ